MEMYKNILVPYDFWEMAEVSLKQTYNLARLTGLDITLLHVHEETGIITKLFGGEEKSDQVTLQIQKQLDEVAARVTAESGIRCRTIIERGRVHAKIIETAEKIQAKFIVMSLTSQFESDPEKKMVGANVSRVIRMAKCPVLTINSKTHYEGCRAILLPLDLTKQTRHKVSWAIELATLFGSKIKVVSGLWSINHEDIVKHIKAQMFQVNRFIEDKGIDVTAELIESEQGHRTLVPSILDYAHKQGDIDLIMIMTQQEVGWVEFFVGSHASEFIRMSDIPVMSILPKDTGERLAR